MLNPDDIIQVLLDHIFGLNLRIQFNKTTILLNSSQNKFNKIIILLI